MENTYREGQFVWRELMTSDVQKARGFYGELFGWTFKEVPMPTGPYVLINKGEQQIAGMMKLPDGAGFPPNWLGYASVPDVDAAVKAATEQGGNAMMPATDIPGVGRIAVLTDSTGAALGLLRNLTGDGPVPPMPPAESTFCWESLNTSDVAKAKVFYPAVLGWTVGTGPGGNMVVFSAGTNQVADAEATPPGVPSHWISHVVVDKLETVRDRAEKLGAKVILPVIEVPQIGRISIIADPMGAALSLFEPAPPAAA